jgi:hypothetical protein
MIAGEICAEISSAMGRLFHCTALNEYVRIRTPYLYPDGDIIDLFCKKEGEIIIITDLGETVRWLRMQSISNRRSPKQNALIDDLCLNHGVEFFKGMLIARRRPGEDLAGRVTQVAQACLRTADLWFTYRVKSMQSVTDEVEDFLRERGIKYQRSEKHIGRSGNPYIVDFHVFTHTHSSLVQVLTTGSRSAARSVREHVFTTWSDLSHLKVGPEALRFLSLFDDTVDIWSEEDFRLLEPLSTIVLWSRPDHFLEELQEAA